MSVGSSKQTLCRLCLNSVGDTDFEIIEEIISGILQVVLPSLDLKTKDKMCRTCYVKLIAAFNFKSMCIDTEDVISSINPEQTPVVELKHVYLKEKGNVQLINMSENQKICRLCMQLVTCGFKSLNEVDVDIILNYIPQVNISATKDPVICGLCFDSLCTHDSFVKNCLNVQENYEQCYSKDEKIEIKAEQSDLCSNLNSEEFKTEKTCLDAQEQYTQSYVKTEEIDIKAEENHQDSDSSHDSFEGVIRNKWRCVFGDSLGKLQINKHKSRIQNSEASLNASSTKCAYENELKNDQRHDNDPELKKYKYGEYEYSANLKESFTGQQSVHQNTSEVPTYKCDRCVYQTNYRWNFRNHLVTHKDPPKEILYKCDRCNFKTIQKCDLMSHKLKHGDISKVQKMYKRVQLIHKDPSEIRMYKCDACNSESKHKGYLRQHWLKQKDPSNVQLYKCDTCSFETRYRGALIRHWSLCEKKRALKIAS